MKFSSARRGRGPKNWRHFVDRLFLSARHGAQISTAAEARVIVSSMRLGHLSLTLCFCLSLIAPVCSPQTAKPPITLDEFLNTTEITEAHLAPDGAAVVIATETPDWKGND